ncbi:MAG: ThiF family adenylyltransferase [Anaerolineae bacterium]
MSEDLARYSRQIILAEFGEEKQRKLLSSYAVLVGCGALGSVIANNVVRAGLGKLRIIDRDYIELNNLHRQVLFDEKDIAENLPKAVAAARKLKAINSEVEVEAVVADFNPDNAEKLLSGADLVLDGTDNFEARYLINDVCLKRGLPWIYSGVIASYGMTMNILPGKTPCLRCFIAEMPPPGTVPTCDTAGVLGAIVGTIGSLASVEAIKLLTGWGQPNPGLIAVDLFDPSFEVLKVERREDCPACAEGHYEFLEAGTPTRAASLCGREAVQITISKAAPLSLPKLASRLEKIGRVSFNEFLLRFQVDDYELTIFPDARAIIKGTNDETLARTLYAKYVGL